MKAATKVVGTLIAAFAMLVALSACGVPDGRAADIASPAEETGTRSMHQAPTATPPAVPRRSAALEDNRALTAPPPSRIEIPDLGIDVRVQPVGLDAQGRMGLFDDPSIAAWYQWGSAPASATGSTVIAAHVDSLEYDLLPFARLKDAIAAMPVFVTDAAGTVHAYAVERLEITGKADVDWPAAFDRSGPPRLTLVTCGGEFDDENRRYLSNLVLTATPTGGSE
ncbi:sortase (surface protein transpeptidase) [Agromyces ramosus]|uniref:Sortase (Surface protein transpeptidase) n=1 Tax=Agromyces ramosus TaxID=33879 RepID=A0A4Q7MI57_9MICO|nr:class F sortase [Agromyces ramosus]RZS66412.1 sortase (surface protein transpeptidase) [Agromyces ramosus]